MTSQSTSSGPTGTTGQPPHPLRPYYQPPQDSVFIATAPRFSTTGTPAAHSTSTSNASSSSSYASPNRYMSDTSKPYVATTSNTSSNASASPFGFNKSRTNDFGESQASFTDVFRALLLSGALQYTSTCLAMPFEVGKLLLQVQWVPRDDVWLQVTQQAAQLNAAAASSSSSTLSRNSKRVSTNEQPDLDDDESSWPDDVSPEAAEWDDERTAQQDEQQDDLDVDSLSDEEDAEAYFRDVASQPSRSTQSSLSASKRQRRKRPVDASGYVIRTSVHDSGARPDFLMPVVVRGGVWEMMKAVARGKEGWFGLWKGSLTSFILETTSSTIQPIVSSILSIFAPAALSPLPLAYAPYPYKTLSLLLSSHLITGILVSPLDLIRTRLIAQSTLPTHRKYSGPYDALQKVLREEGGWKTAYLHPNLLIPTILDFTLRPLLSLSAPLLIEHNLRLDPNTAPISYAVAELALSTFALCITLPIETVRRRLQLQMRSRSAGSRQNNDGDANRKPKKRITSSTLQSQSQSQMKQAGFSLDTTASVGLSPKPLRTCVETRPLPYVGVVEAIYRILTEETSVTPAASASSSSAKSGQQNTSTSSSSDTNDSAKSDTKQQEPSSAMYQSGILAKPNGHSSLGGLKSLYRGFGMAFGANLVVFMLTIVTGERSAGSGGWAEI